MDEVYIVIVRGERLYLWRAVDQDGDVLDILVQKRKNKGSAVRLFKKLMKGQERSAKKIVTDKLPSYGAARKAVMPTSMHCHDRYANTSRRSITSTYASTGAADARFQILRSCTTVPFGSRSSS
jgi:transposase-like protein